MSKTGRFAVRNSGNANLKKAVSGESAGIIVNGIFIATYINKPYTYEIFYWLNALVLTVCHLLATGHSHADPVSGYLASAAAVPAAGAHGHPYHLYDCCRFYAAV